MAFEVSFPVRSAYKDESFRLRCLTGKGADGIVPRLRTVTYNARTCGPYAWTTLPERDEYEHSQNSASGSITPPCQNRGPAKDELETLWRLPGVGGVNGADANNSETQRPALADCERPSRTWVVVLSRKLLRRAATGFSQRRSTSVHAESLRAQ